jgi:putative hemolysin
MPPEPDGSIVPLLPMLSKGGAVQDVHPFFPILLLVVLILINAFFAASEIAVITLNDNKIQKMAQDGDKKAAKLVKLTSNSSRFFSTIQIGVTLAGFLTSASASESFADGFAAFLSFLPFSPSFTKGLATVLITLLLAYFNLLFGELVPKKIAIQRAEDLSFKFVGVLSASATVFRPVVSFLTASTNAMLRVFGVDPNSKEDTVTEEEILMMVDAGEEKGVLNENAKDMISNIFDFSDITADEAMTHRTDVSAVEDTQSVQDVVALSMEKGYSRIPVFHEDLDNILGVVYVKDLLKYVGSSIERDVKVTDLMRPAYFVPESKPCSELFSEMTAHRVQIAIVVDEYGGTEGIITMEDLLESIVGSIQDEYDHEEEEIQQVGENRFNVDGSASIDEIADLTGVDFPEGDYDTVAGFMMEKLGRIPRPDEHPRVRMKNLTLTVGLMEDRRIAEILIEKEPEKALPETGEEEEPK